MNVLMPIVYPDRLSRFAGIPQVKLTGPPRGKALAQDKKTYTNSGKNARSNKRRVPPSAGSDVDSRGGATYLVGTG
jgi:hypothetical protein